MEDNTLGSLSLSLIYLPPNKLKLAHMKSMQNQKTRFLKNFQFSFMHTFCQMCYINIFLWWFDLICSKFWNQAVPEILENKVIFHFVIFFCCKLCSFTHFLGIFSKTLIILQLITYCKNTTLFKCLHLQVHSSNLYSMKFFLKNWHPLSQWTATTGHGVTRKRSTKRLQYTGNLFRRNLQLKDLC